MSRSDTESTSESAAGARPAGTYITIEGVDGCGKSTLHTALFDEFPGAVFTEEPKESLWTGRACRGAFQRDTGPFTDALLLMADRAEHIYKVVGPALSDGELVISDRSADSTYAYQSRRVEAEDPWAWFDDVLGPFDVEPDLTLWIDVPLDVAMERVDGDEKYESREKLRRVKLNYEKLNMRHRERYHRLDGTDSEEEILDEAVRAIEAVL